MSWLALLALGCGSEAAVDLEELQLMCSLEKRPEVCYQAGRHAPDEDAWYALDIACESDVRDSCQRLGKLYERTQDRKVATSLGAICREHQIPNACGALLRSAPTKLASYPAETQDTIKQLAAQARVP